MNNQRVSNQRAAVVQATDNEPRAADAGHSQILELHVSSFAAMQHEALRGAPPPRSRLELPFRAREKNGGGGSDVLTPEAPGDVGRAWNLRP
jgi:hypothetical protein